MQTEALTPLARPKPLFKLSLASFFRGPSIIPRESDKRPLGVVFSFGEPDNPRSRAKEERYGEEERRSREG